MNSRYVIFLSGVLYIISMFLPGIIYVASIQDNPKNGLCAFATNQEFSCVLSKNGHSCSRIAFGKEDPNAMTQQQVLDYCGQDWNVPTSHIHYGYWILAFGWLGVFIGNFAWLGNVLFIIAFIFALRKNRKGTIIASTMALVFGLTAFFLNSVPRNEGRVNDYLVDHLGSGYYVWLLAIIALIIYGYLSKSSPLQNQVGEEQNKV